MTKKGSLENQWRIMQGVEEWEGLVYTGRSGKGLQCRDPENKWEPGQESPGGVSRLSGPC